MELLDDEPAERHFVLSRFFGGVFLVDFPRLLCGVGSASRATVDLSYLWDQCLIGVRSSLDDQQCRTAFLSQGFARLVRTDWAWDLLIRDLAIRADDGKARRIRAYLINRFSREKQTIRETSGSHLCFEN